MNVRKLGVFMGQVPRTRNKFELQLYTKVYLFLCFVLSYKNLAVNHFLGPEEEVICMDGLESCVGDASFLELGMGEKKCAMGGMFSRNFTSYYYRTTRRSIYYHRIGLLQIVYAELRLLSIEICEIRRNFIRKKSRNLSELKIF